MQKVIERREAITVPEHSPVGGCQSNGMVENACKRLAGQILTLKCHLEATTGAKIIAEHAIFGWKVEWAAQLLTRFTIYANGKSPYFKIKGRRSGQALASFGESVHYMPLKCSGKTIAKFGDKLLPGVWLGLNLRTDESLIGTAEGVVKALTVRRRPADEAWQSEDVLGMAGTPEFPVPGRYSDHVLIDVHLPPGCMGVPEEDAIGPYDDDQPGEHVTSKAKIPVSLLTTVAKPDDEVSNMYITKKILDEFGATPGCPGCSSKGQKTGHAHNAECRQRMRLEMSKTEIGRDRMAREQTRIERHEERTSLKQAQQDPGMQMEMQKHEGEVKTMESGQDEDVAIYTPEDSKTGCDTAPRVTGTKRRAGGSPDDESLCRPHVTRQLEYDVEEWIDAFGQGNRGLLPSQVKDRQSELGDKAWQLPNGKQARDDEFQNKDDLFKSMKDTFTQQRTSEVVDLTMSQPYFRMTGRDISIRGDACQLSTLQF